jgi:hypothetical protein
MKFILIIALTVAVAFATTAQMKALETVRVFYVD